MNSTLLAWIILSIIFAIIWVLDSQSAYSTLMLLVVPTYLILSIGLFFSWFIRRKKQNTQIKTSKYKIIIEIIVLIPVSIWSFYTLQKLGLF